MLTTLHPFLSALLGGVLIGLASWLLLAGLGRIAGISGIAATAWFGPGDAAKDGTWRWAFLLGLVAIGALATWVLGVPAAAPKSALLLGTAGLCVGFGTVLGSGCTSGHGVCGIGRRSKRSLVATLVFMATGFATVFIANYHETAPAYGP